LLRARFRHTVTQEQLRRDDEIQFMEVNRPTSTKTHLENAMKIQDVMTRDPVCCLSTDTAQAVAKIMLDRNIGSVPVVTDQQSRKLTGIVTDRDLCCSIVAQGLDPKSTPIQRYMRQNPVACRAGENMDSCEQAMQKHQIRRMPVTDSDGRVIGIVAQADLALKEEPAKLSKTIGEISRPQHAAA
jgi:CBS domain-containing protein